MPNPFLPGTHKLTEQVIRVPYRVEQHEADKKQEETELPREIPLRHDPYWNRRFWSIQHVHDCIEGKAFHWFWSPMAEVFSLSQIMFMIIPAAVYMNDKGNHVGIRGLILMILSLKCLMFATRRLLEWYHNWQFKRTPYKVIQH